MLPIRMWFQNATIRSSRLLQTLVEGLACHMVHGVEVYPEVPRAARGTKSDLCRQGRERRTRSEGWWSLVDEAMVNAAMAYVRELFGAQPGSHDVNHTMRVYRNAQRIARDEPGCDLEVVALASLLHDADDHKLFQTQGNANARAFLVAQHVGEERIERICEVINGVSFSKNRGRRPTTIEGMVVQDADRLDALGAIGVARTFAYGGEHGRSLESSVQHFHEKLLLLKDEMNTDAGRALAEERHAFLVSFLQELDQEEAL